MRDRLEQQGQAALAHDGVQHVRSSDQINAAIAFSTQLRHERLRLDHRALAGYKHLIAAPTPVIDAAGVCPLSSRDMACLTVASDGIWHWEVEARARDHDRRLRREPALPTPFHKVLVRLFQTQLQDIAEPAFGECPKITAMCNQAVGLGRQLKEQSEIVRRRQATRKISPTLGILQSDTAVQAGQEIRVNEGPPRRPAPMQFQLQIKSAQGHGFCRRRKKSEYVLCHNGT